MHAGVLTNTMLGPSPSTPSSVFIASNFLYVTSAATNTLEIIDISIPSVPVRKGIISDGFNGAVISAPSAVFVVNNFAYVLNQGGSLEILDVVDPANPVHKGNITNGTSGAMLSNPVSFNVVGDYAYVVSTQNNALEIIDISIPTAPVHKGSIINGTGGALLNNPTSVFVSGNFAYVASNLSNALEVIDVSNPAAPIHKGSISHGTGGALLALPYSVYVSGNYAYVVSQGSNALEIVDVSNPANPVHKGSLTNGAGGAILGTPNNVFVRDNIAFVTSTVSNALEIIDVSNPANPLHRGSITNGAGGALLSDPRNVVVNNNHAYIASSGSDAVEIIDISNSSSPVHVTNVIRQKAFLSFPQCVAISGNFAYIPYQRGDNGGYWLEIIDVSDPLNPKFKDILKNQTSGSNSSYCTVVVSGNYAYITGSTMNAFVVVDITNPAIPVHKSTTVHGSGGAILQGAQTIVVDGVYAYITGQALNGVEILNISNPSAPSHVTTFTHGTGGALLQGSYGLAKDGDYLYVASNISGGLEILNVSNPELPFRVGNVLGPEGSGSIYKAGNYIYSSDDAGLNLITTNVTNPAAPVVTSNIRTWPGNFLYINGSGNNLFLGTMTQNGSFQVIDISNPSSPLHKTGFEHGTNGAQLKWPTSIAIAGNYAYVTGNLGSLEIISLFTPSPPVLSTATSISENSFNVSWVSRPGVTGYFVDLSTDNFSTFVTGYNEFLTTATSIATAGLTPGTTYQCRVRAINGNGNSLNSNVISVTTLPTAPTATPALSVTKTSLTARWNSVSNVFGYYLDVSSDGFSSTLPGFKNLYVAGTNQIVNDLLAGTVYYYRVRTVNSAGNSAYSNTITLSTIPADPIAISGTSITQTAFMANWNSTIGSSGYYLDVSSDNFITFLTGYNNFPTTSTSVNISGLVAGTSYQYRVRAGNPSGISGNSNTIFVLTVPSPPSSSTANAFTQNGFTINWPSVINATGYSLDVATNSSFSSILSGYNNLSISPTSQNLTGLTAGTTYYYRLRSNNASGTSISSIIFSNITIPPNPVATSANNFSTTGFDAKWISSTGATGYFMDVSSDDFTTVLPAYNNIFVGNVTTFSVVGLNAASNYKYRIRASNNSGSSGNSNLISASTTTLPTIAGLATSITQTSFMANWSAVTGALGYYLDVALDVNFTSILSNYNNLVVTDTSKPVTGLSPGTNYHYRLRSYNITGVSPNSNTITTVTVPPNPVALTASNFATTEFNANWSTTVGASSYYLDVSTDNFVTFIPDFDNKLLGNIVSYKITGLMPGKAYNYRIRASNIAGTSSNSNVISGLTVSNPPVAIAATSIGQISFVANWSAPPSATGYFLDVATSSDFVSILANYTSLFVGNTISISISGLSAGTQYFYRVRAQNESGVSANSNIITATTLNNSGVGLQIGIPVYSETFLGLPSNVSVEISGGTTPYTVTFEYRKIAAPTFSSKAINDPAATKYQVSVETSMLDEIGIEFYFKVTDATGTPRQTLKQYIYKAVPSEGIKIPFTKFGGTKESYELFSIPYELAKNGAADIFDELGAIDKSKWRLSRYQNRKNIDVGAGLTAIEQGKGYWFNSREKIDVFFSNGTVTKANQSTPFKLVLDSEWNQIGNPYPFNVDWDDIVALSSNKNDIGKLIVFNAEQFTLTDESNNLKAWSGGFVFNSSNQRIELDVPVTLRNSAGGRKATSDQLTADLSSRDWFVPLAIAQEGIINHTSGFGMHSEASLSKDYYDEMVVPRFINYLEFYTTHTDYFYPWFAKDMVPPSNSNSWEFSFESNLKGPVELSWIKEDLGMNEAQLFLFDPIAGVLLDMKKSNRYRFEPGSNQSIRLFYGASEKELSPDVNALNAAWPNPFSGETNISFVVKDKSSKVTLAVYDLMGKKINQLVEGVYDSGVYSSQWQGNDARGEQAAAGLYMVRLEINGFVSSQRIIKK